MSIYESIPYEVVETYGTIEIRRYESFLLASTKTNPNNRQDSGFGNVFRYITGNNEPKEKISMTTPVVTYEEDEQLVTGFYVPSKYDMKTVPKPTGQNVYINEQKAAYYIVIRFRGSWTKTNYDKHQKQLLQFIEEHNYQVTSPQLIMRYNPPMVPGLFRRNEIAYQINENSI